MKDLKNYQKKINTSPATLPELPPEVVKTIVKLLSIHQTLQTTMVNLKYKLVVSPSLVGTDLDKWQHKELKTLDEVREFLITLNPVFQYKWELSAKGIINNSYPPI